MIDTAITYMTPIKRELRRLGARGDKPHAMLDSIESQLPDGLVANLRFVITIRNKVVHGHDVPDISVRQFTAACQRALEGLAQFEATTRPAAVVTNPLVAPAIRLAVTLFATLLTVVAYALVARGFPLDSLESWGVPLLTLAVLTVQAQATRVRHRLLVRLAARPLSHALAWLSGAVASVVAAAYLFPPPPHLLPVALMAAGVSLLFHVIIGVHPGREAARVAL